MKRDIFSKLFYPAPVCTGVQGTGGPWDRTSTEYNGMESYSYICCTGPQTQLARKREHSPLYGIHGENWIENLK